MRLLLDTHLLVWAASEPERLSKEALNLVQDHENELIFSVVSIWEMAIKYPLGKLDPSVEPRKLRDGLLKSG